MRDDRPTRYESREPAWHSLAILIATAPIAATMLPIWATREIAGAILRWIIQS